MNSLSQPVSGRVTDQNGDPVNNATVRVTGVDYNNINPAAAQTKRDRAEELLDQAKDPIPESWQPNFQLVGSGNQRSNGDARYPVVHQPDAIGGGSWFDGADLTPQFRVDANQKVFFTVWDPTADPGLVAGEYDSQLPGADVSDTIVLEELDSTGDVIQTHRVETSQHSGGGFLDPSALKFGELYLSPGFYRISVEGSPVEYTFVAGNPQQIAATIEEDLRNEADQLTQKAKNIRDRFQNNKFTAATVTTNASGYYTVTVGQSVKTVAVTAYKAGSLDLTGSEHPLTLARTLVESQSYNGSIYVPSTTKTYEVPTSEADVTLRELSGPPHGNLSELQDKLDWLKDRLANATQRIEDLLQQINASREELESVYDRLTNLTEQNVDLKQRVEDLLQNRTGSTEVIVDATDATTAELRARIAAMNDAMDELRNQIGSETGSSTNPETVDATAWFDGALGADQVAVFAHFSNGTTTAVPEEYVTVDASPTTIVGQGQTAVRIQEFPLGDASSVQFEWRVARPDGVASATERVRNPLVDARAPDIDSVRVSTLAPGPSDTVTVEFNPAAGASFGSLQAVDVYAPNGTALGNAVVENGRTATFTTDGAGEYTVVATYTRAGESHNFTKVFSLRAEATDFARPPSVKAMSGPTGTYALVGDGLDGGDVEVATDGGLDLSACIESGDDVPATVEAYTGTVDETPTGDIEFRLLRCGSEQTVRKHVTVTVHAKAVSPAETYIYRGERAPITESGSDAGTVTFNNNGTVVETFTDADGSVRVRILQPTGIVDSVVQETLWIVRTTEFPVVGSIPITVLPGLFLVARRRRNSS